MNERRKINEMVDDVSTWEFEGTLSTVLERVQAMIQEHGPDARLDYNRNFYYEYDNDPTPRFELYVEREENDAELKQRLFEQAEHIRKREEAEKAEFERLSKKFKEVT
jgi:hypothetical protein